METIKLIGKDLILDTGGRTLLMQGDSGAPAVRFELARYQDGIDLAACGCTVQTRGGDGAPDIAYPQIETQAQTLAVTWRPSTAQTAAPGTLTVQLCFERVDENGLLAEVWRSSATALQIGESVQAGDALMEQKPTLFQQWEQRMGALGTALNEGTVAVAAHAKQCADDAQTAAESSGRATEAAEQAQAARDQAEQALAQVENHTDFYLKAESDARYAPLFHGHVIRESPVLSDVRAGADCKQLKLRGNLRQQTTRQGKNLFTHSAEMPCSANGLTIDFDKETGEYILNGTVAGTWVRTVLALRPFAWKSGQLYSLRVTKTGGTVIAAGEKDFVLVAEAYSGGSQLSERQFIDIQLVGGAQSNTQIYTSGAALAESAGQMCVYFDPWFCGGNVFQNYRLRLQLEEGTASEWEVFSSESPSPDFPAPIACPGEGGSLALSISDGTTAHAAEIAVTAPFAALPGDVFDELNLLTGDYTRRTARRAFDGAQTWNLSAQSGGFLLFSLPLDGAGAGQILCDRFSPIWSDDLECVRLNEGLLELRILPARLVTADAAGLSTWLAEHPVSVYYPLAQPASSSFAPPDLAFLAPQSNLAGAGDPPPVWDCVYPRDAERCLDLLYRAAL